MIGRLGLIAGALAGVVYLGLVGAYAVVSTVSIPLWAMGGIGVIAVGLAALGTQLAVSTIEAWEGSEDI